MVSLFKSREFLYSLLFLPLLFFSACSLHNYKHSSSKIITIKTPLLKFSDLGYIKKSNNSVRLELFIAGRNVQNIEINYLICVDDGCMSKSLFNRKFLSDAYPDELLENILFGKKIFDAKNVLKSLEGFEQRIESERVDIIYRVSQKEIYFKDKKNRILFKIKDIE